MSRKNLSNLISPDSVKQSGALPVQIAETQQYVKIFITKTGMLRQRFPAQCVIT